VVRSNDYVTADRIVVSILLTDFGRRVLMIVKNYTGDKLNFGLTAQKAKVEGINVNAVFVGYDVSVNGNKLVGRRGLAGVVFVHKIAGALAATGYVVTEIMVAALFLKLALTC
jgi:dihydroxyacetone kinase